MGSFNVACSMSNISINCGTKVAFFPLIANWASYMEEHYGIKNDGTVRIGPETQLVSNDGCFQLYSCFSLPIFGTYDDYGGVEDIEESETTRAIEKYFGITINEFMECATNSRSFYDYFSGPFNVYVPEEKKKLLSDYSVKFNKAWIQKLGFKSFSNGEKDCFVHPKCDGFVLKLEKYTAPKDSHNQNGWIYSISKDGKEISKASETYDVRKKFFKDWHKATNYYLLVGDEKQKKIDAIQRVGGMFVHYEIYRHMVDVNISEYGGTEDSTQGTDGDVNDYALTLAGFKFIEEDKKHDDRYSKLYMHPGVDSHAMLSDGTWSHIAKKQKGGNYKQIRGHSTYRLTELVKEWKEVTGVQIEIPEAKMKESKYGPKFDKLQKEVKTFIDSKDNESKFEEILTRIFDEKATEQDLEFAKAMSMSNDDSKDDKTLLNELAKILIRMQYSNHPMDRNKHCGFYLCGSLSDWNGLQELYTESVADGTIKQDLIDFSHFYWNSYQNNRIFMPAANGCQCGNHYATRALAKKTFDIMDAQIKEYEEEYEDA